MYYSQHLQFFYLPTHFLIQYFPYHHFRSGLPLFIKYLSFLIFLSIDQKISFIKFPLPSLLLLLLRHSPQIHSSHLIHLFIIIHSLNRYQLAFLNSPDAAAGLLKRLEVSSQEMPQFILDQDMLENLICFLSSLTFLKATNFNSFLNFSMVHLKFLITFFHNP